MHLVAAFVMPLVAHNAKLTRRHASEEPTAMSEAGLLLLAGGVGATTGTAVSLLKLSIAGTESFAYNEGLRSLFMLAPASNTAAVSTLVYAAVPALGGVAVSALRPLFEARNQEIGALSRAAAAVATLGTGNSLGPEGPAVDLGKAVSASLSRLGERHRQVLVGAGSAAAVAAGFSAPVAGVFFALEVAFPGNSSRSAVAATAVAASVSALVARDVMQCRLELIPTNVASGGVLDLPSYLGLGALAGVVALALRRAISVFSELWSDHGTLGFVPAAARPAVGGALCGAIGVACPPVLFNGYATLNTILADTSPPEASTLLYYCGVKIVTTASSVGCGLVGGLFAPALFLGATAGGAYGQFVADVASALPLALAVPAPPAYAAVGAASVLAALLRAPLAAAMLLFELTRDYDVVLPLIASAGVAAVVVELIDMAPASSSQTTATIVDTPAVASRRTHDEDDRDDDDDDDRVVVVSAATTAGAAAGDHHEPQR